MKTLTLCCLLLTTITPALAATGKPTTVTGRLAHGFWGFSITPQKGPRIDFPDEASFKEQVWATCQIGDLCTLSGLVRVDGNGDHQLTELTSVTLVKTQTLDTRSAAEKAEGHGLIPMTCVGQVFHYGEASGLGPLTATGMVYPADSKLAAPIDTRCEEGEVCKMSGLGKIIDGSFELTVIQTIERIKPDVIIPTHVKATPAPDSEYELRGQLEAGQDGEGAGFWLRGNPLAKVDRDKNFYIKLIATAALDGATRGKLAQLV
ncbi:MAG: hypothetical protein PHU14_07895, partial [Methylovulum sp.]|nr:hypothetical protein [Methylovulum sp.]